MKTIFLIKPGEFVLKGDNRPFFARALRRDIKEKLKKVSHTLEDRHNRLFVRVAEEDAEAGEACLRRVFGISGFCRTHTAAKNIEAMEAMSVKVVEEVLARRRGVEYKIAVHRTDKSFPLDSYGLACEMGDRLGKKFPELKVNVKNPDWVLHLEIRDKVYGYAFAEEGERGLPAGVAGKGLLLLSGGIDSPVAGYLMAKRGLKIDAVYFHSYPYTGNEAREKVETLSRILSGWVGRIHLSIIPFTDIQVRIRERAPAEETVLLSRACMMSIASRLAFRRRAVCLITGESLSQVASQTAESMGFTGVFSELPVFRPLIGSDKEWIIRKARHVGTYETSILPYEDCCTVFASRHPLTRPRFLKMMESFKSLEIDELLQSALRGSETRIFAP
jgi:thiamine biosynthesis protein ThiI